MKIHRIFLSNLVAQSRRTDNRRQLHIKLKIVVIQKDNLRFVAVFQPVTTTTHAENHYYNDDENCNDNSDDYSNMNIQVNYRIIRVFRKTTYSRTYNEYTLV